MASPKSHEEVGNPWSTSTGVRSLGPPVSSVKTRPSGVLTLEPRARHASMGIIGPDRTRRCVLSSTLIDHAEGLFFVYMSALLFAGYRRSAPRRDEPA